MKVVFRVDSSTRMGIGHLMRCLTLAKALRERAIQTQFICRELAGNLIALLQQNAIPVTVLPTPSGNDTTSNEDYAAWLGVTQETDAKQTIKVLNCDKPDWLIVDHYGLDIEWEQYLRPHIVKLMVIDDLANRHHDCDLLLDQNYSPDVEKRYAGLVPESCELYIGPRYALLRAEYAAYRKTIRDRTGLAERVLIFFGGTDSKNMTGLTLEALTHPNLTHLNVDVVIGANNPHMKAIEQQVLLRPLTKLHGHRPHLADLMTQADLAFGAGGATTWERMCLGLPTVVISLAENQRPASEALAEAKLVQYAGHFSNITLTQLTQELQQLSHNAERLADLSTQNLLQVDGLGALRMVEVICPSSKKQIRLRSACKEDIYLYYNWANEHEVLKNAHNRSTISWKTHQTWFADKLHDINSHLFVLEETGLPLGQIRFDRDGDEARIDYSLDKIVRERGWDSLLVALGADLMQQIEPVRLCAKVKAGNEVPSAIFLSLGLTETSNVSRGGADHSIAILSDRASWINEYICKLMLDWLAVGYRVLWVHDKKDLLPANFCFYLSCSQIVPANILSQYRHNLVVHESDLPRGKGWSPLTWQVLEGKNCIPVTLLEAAEKVDSGVIYAQEWIEFEGHELIDELRAAQAQATIKLCNLFVEGFPQILNGAREQTGSETFYPRRCKMDSELDPMQSIVAQFNHLRVVDNHRYPALFCLNNHRYFLRIEKIKSSSNEQGIQHD